MFGAAARALSGVLNKTRGTILLICFLLADTSQISPKTAQYWPCYA